VSRDGGDDGDAVMQGAGMGSGVVGEVGGAGPGVCGEGAICRGGPRAEGIEA
jgi:hypothetical protein